MWFEVRKFRALPLERRLLALEAAGGLAVFRLALGWVPFRWLAGRLGSAGAESPLDLAPDQDATAQAVAWAIAAASRRVPWHSSCLVLALAAWWMLRRRGLPSTLYFGVARSTAGRFDAHAWLRCGEQLVCGGEIRGRYQVIARFA